MRHFFIRSLDILIGLFVVLGILGVLAAAYGVMVGGFQSTNGVPGGGGVPSALFVLVAGMLYIAFVAGFLYLGVGIYHNTRRTAEAVETLVRKQGAARSDTALRSEPKLRKEPTL